MKIKVKPMGEYQTNCYILTINQKDIIIDPGVNALNWIEKHITNPIAILNTHGHFDHIWDNQKVKNRFDIKLYSPIDDIFMLEEDIFNLNMPISKADYKIKPDNTIIIDNIKIKFHHFPGHTPGCSAIQVDDILFSGDFIFKNSIGRVDFPYSNPSHMKNSINKILKWTKDIKIYPGHGTYTYLNKEKTNLQKWLKYI